MDTQSNIFSKLQKKRKKIYGAQGSAQTIIVIDDVNMPEMEEISGSQPPIELLRQIIDSGGFYDRPSFKRIEIERFTMICAAAPPSGGRSPLTPRFMSHF